MKKPVIGQEAVIVEGEYYNKGLGRVTDFEIVGAYNPTISVKLYSDGQIRKVKPSHVRLVKINYED